jgi:DNA-binding transcriptional regulator GbsR (MarR family)
MKKSVDTTDIAKIKFLEDTGINFEGFGLPNHAGRIVAWLIICKPEIQTSDELAKNLHMSKGSVSSMSRLLEMWGFIEKFKKPMQRGYFFRLKKNSWIDIIQNKIKGMNVVYSIMKKADSDFGDTDKSVHERLQTVVDIYEFFIVEFEKIFVHAKELFQGGNR